MYGMYVQATTKQDDICYTIVLNTFRLLGASRPVFLLDFIHQRSLLHGCSTHKARYLVRVLRLICIHRTVPLSWSAFVSSLPWSSFLRAIPLSWSAFVRTMPRHVHLPSDRAMPGFVDGFGRVGWHPSVPWLAQRVVVTLCFVHLWYFGCCIFTDCCLVSAVGEHRQACLVLLHFKARVCHPRNASAVLTHVNSNKSRCIKYRHQRSRMCSLCITCRIVWRVVEYRSSSPSPSVSVVYKLPNKTLRTHCVWHMKIMKCTIMNLYMRCNTYI